MGGNILGSGLMERCMGRANLHGVMEESTKANFYMTKGMATAFLIGRMVGFIEGSG